MLFMYGERRHWQRRPKAPDRFSCPTAVRRVPIHIYDARVNVPGLRDRSLEKARSADHESLFGDDRPTTPGDM